MTAFSKAAITTKRKISTPQPGVWVEVDPADAATPVLVCCKVKGELMTSTYDCVMGTGFVEDVIEINQKTFAWLEGMSDCFEATIDKARDGHPDYPD